MEYIGFHGTTIENADSIDKSFFFDSNNSSWLGRGVYFFEDIHNFQDGREKAKWWMECCKKQSTYMIYKVRITSDLVFDMVLNNDALKEFKTIEKKLIEKYKELGKSLTTFTPFCVFNMLNKKYEVIRATVDSSKFLEHKSYLVEKPQVQICVCNNKENVIKIINKEAVNYV